MKRGMGGEEKKGERGGVRKRERETPSTFWSGCADGGDEELVGGPEDLSPSASSNTSVRKKKKSASSSLAGSEPR